MRSVLVLLALAGCDDYVLGPGGAPPDTDVAEGYCAVVELVSAQCIECHGDEGPLGGLDLSDPATALVDVPATTEGAGLLVVPNDPAASFFLTKIAGDVPPGQGGPMPPPRGDVDAATVDAIRAWIADGASDTCAPGG